MKNIIIKTLLMFSFSVFIYGQETNKNISYILIDCSCKDLYKFDLNKKKANLKILYYNKKKQGFSSNQKKYSSTDKDDIVEVAKEPNANFYEFNSISPPETITNIDDLKIYSIQDVSKNNKEVFSNDYKAPFFFLEKISCKKYNLWKMRLEMIE